MGLFVKEDQTPEQKAFMQKLFKIMGVFWILVIVFGLYVVTSTDSSSTSNSSSSSVSSGEDVGKSDRCHRSCKALGAFEMGRDAYNKCHANCMRP